MTPTVEHMESHTVAYIRTLLTSPPIVNRDRRLPAWSGFSEIQAFQRYTPALYIIDYDKSQTTEVRKETHACTL